MPDLDSPIRLRWRRSGREHDFEARDGDDYARIYRLDAGPQGDRWWWGASRSLRSHGAGHADTAREAALAAEEAYFGPPMVEIESPFVAGFEDPSMPT